MRTSLIDAITLNRQNVKIYTRSYHPCRLLPHRKEDNAFQTPHKLCVPAGSVRSPPEACVLLIQREWQSSDWQDCGQELSHSDKALKTNANINQSIAREDAFTWPLGGREIDQVSKFIVSAYKSAKLWWCSASMMQFIWLRNCDVRGNLWRSLQRLGFWFVGK